MLFDTHAHLHFPEFDGDQGAVLERARAAGVRYLLTVGTDAETSARAVALAEADPDIYASVGVHPHDAAGADEAALAEITRLAETSRKVVAVGEIGLDYYRDLSPREVQVQVFRRQLSFARQLGKPVVIHCREAHLETLEILREEGVKDIRGIMHCFSGDEDAARRCLDLGLLISLAGPVTYPNARKLPGIVKLVPEDRVVVETDCPFLPPQPFRGKRNEPSYLPITAARVAELRGRSVESLGPAMTRNALSLFGVAGR
ncbi:MAG: TatD family hydrolase [Candidatus Methylomirabilia bacterium]